MEAGWNLLAIYFGIIAFFGGLVIPLYYSLAVDILEQVAANDRHKLANGLKSHWTNILLYSWASDFVVYSMGLMGATGVLAGALVADRYCHHGVADMCVRRILEVVLVYCGILTFFGSYTIVRRGEEHIDSKGRLQDWQFIVFSLIVVLTVSGAWWLLASNWAPDLEGGTRPTLVVFVLLLGLWSALGTLLCVLRSKADRLAKLKRWKWRLIMAGTVILAVMALSMVWVYLMPLQLPDKSCDNDAGQTRAFMVDTLYALAGLYFIWLLLAAIYRPMTGMYELKRSGNLG